MAYSISLKHQLFAIFCASAIGFVGCSKPTPEVTKSAQQRASQAIQSEQPTNISPNAITGVWFGTASLDTNKLQQKVQGLTQEEQNAVAAKAQSFLSTVMAMDFRANGTVENEVELKSIDGQVIRDGSVGQWKVVEAKPNGLLVETQEKMSNGIVTTNQVFYQFFANGNQIAISVPVSQDLEGCDSMLVFERRTLPPTNVAEASNGTVTK